MKEYIEELIEKSRYDVVRRFDEQFLLRVPSLAIELEEILEEAEPVAQRMLDNIAFSASVKMEYLIQELVQKLAETLADEADQCMREIR